MDDESKRDTAVPQRGPDRDAARPSRKPAPHSHIRITGMLRAARRGAIFEADDDRVWRAYSEIPLVPFIDTRVIAEARVGEQDELLLLWIGPATNKA